MTDYRGSGALQKSGSAQEKGSDNGKTAARDVMNQTTGAVQDAFGQAADAVAEGADTVKKVAIEGHDSLKKFIEDNPYTATLLGIGIGIFIGYAAHQPPRRRYWWD